MKLAFIIFAAIFISSCSSTIYVVRHAEKAPNDGRMTSDPDLSELGQKRAIALKDSLAGKPLNNIYATQYKRTLQTAQPTASAQNIAVYRYNAAASDSLMEALSHKQKKQFLVVGHSNTVLGMLKKIGLTPSMQEIPESDFDNLFIVRINWFLGRHISLTERTYGVPTR